MRPDVVVWRGNVRYHASVRYLLDPISHSDLLAGINNFIKSLKLIFKHHVPELPGESGAIGSWKRGNRSPETALVASGGRVKRRSRAWCMGKPGAEVLGS